MRLSGSFNLASGSFLAVPALIINSSNLPFGAQGRSWKPRNKRQKGFPAHEPHCTKYYWVSLPYINSTYFELHIQLVSYIILLMSRSSTQYYEQCSIQKQFMYSHQYKTLLLRTKVKTSLSVVSDALGLHGLYSSWNSSVQNTGVGTLSLLHGMIPTQGWNPSLLHCRRILYQLSPKGSFYKQVIIYLSFCQCSFGLLSVISFYT